MCRIDSLLRKLIRLEYLIFQTLYTFFSIFSLNFSFTHSTLYDLCFQVLTTTFPFLAFSTFSFLCLFLQLYKRKYKSRTGGGRYSIFPGKGEKLIWGSWHFIGVLDNPLETMLYYLTLISL